MGVSDEERAELVRKGAVPTTAREWLGLDDADMKVIDLRARLSREVKRRRLAAKMSQKALADRMNVSQPRIPAIESGAGVTLENVITAFLATGGSMADLARVVEANA